MIVKAKALKNKVLVTNLEKGQRVVNGIILPDDDGKSEGIRPRWCKVYSVGPGIVDIVEGQWILVEHLRWTRMLKIKEDDGTEIKLWGVDWPESVLMVSDEKPETSIFSQWT